MTEQEALHLVGRMRVVVQKFRSNIIELGEDVVRVSEMTHPWMWGKQCILRGIEIIEERGAVTPGEFYNLMYVINRPEMRQVSGVLGDDFPEPDGSWLAGWEEASIYG